MAELSHAIRSYHRAKARYLVAKYGGGLVPLINPDTLPDDWKISGPISFYIYRKGTQTIYLFGDQHTSWEGGCGPVGVQSQTLLQFNRNCTSLGNCVTIQQIIEKCGEVAASKGKTVPVLYEATNEFNRNLLHTATMIRKHPDQPTVEVLRGPIIDLMLYAGLVYGENSQIVDNATHHSTREKLTKRGVEFVPVDGRDSSSKVTEAFRDLIGKYDAFRYSFLRFVKVIKSDRESEIHVQKVFKTCSSYLQKLIDTCRSFIKVPIIRDVVAHITNVPTMDPSTATVKLLGMIAHEIPGFTALSQTLSTEDKSLLDGVLDTIANKIDEDMPLATFFNNMIYIANKDLTDGDKNIEEKNTMEFLIYVFQTLRKASYIDLICTQIYIDIPVFIALILQGGAKKPYMDTTGMIVYVGHAHIETYNMMLLKAGYTELFAISPITTSVCRCIKPKFSYRQVVEFSMY